MHITRRYRVLFNTRKEYKATLNKAYDFVMKDVYVKINPLRSNVWEQVGNIYQLKKLVRKIAEELGIYIETPDETYVAFWWLWEDEWPDDWYRDHPKWPPSYDKMSFRNSWSEASFLMNSINSFMKERLGYIKRKPRDINETYFILDEVCQALFHFLRRWKRVNSNWGKKYSHARLRGWNIDYDN